MLTDGTVFDKQWSQDGIKMDVPKGVSEAVRWMRVGEVADIFMSAKLGYGI